VRFQFLINTLIKQYLFNTQNVDGGWGLHIEARKYYVWYLLAVCGIAAVGSRGKSSGSFDTSEKMDSSTMEELRIFRRGVNFI
jgi:hypothetical protein